MLNDSALVSASSVVSKSVSSNTLSSAASPYFNSAVTASKSLPGGSFPSTLNGETFLTSPKPGLQQARREEHDVSTSPSFITQKKVTMQTRVAIRTKNPHRFQIIPLHEVKNYHEAWLSNMSNGNRQTSSPLSSAPEKTPMRTSSCRTSFPLSHLPHALLGTETNVNHEPTSVPPSGLGFSLETPPCTLHPPHLVSDNYFSSIQSIPLRFTPHDRRPSIEHVLSDACLFRSSPADFVDPLCQVPRSTLRYHARESDPVGLQSKTSPSSAAVSSRKRSRIEKGLDLTLSSGAGIKIEGTKRHAIYSRSLYISNPERFTSPAFCLKEQGISSRIRTTIIWPSEGHLDNHTHVRSDSQGSSHSTSSASSCYSQASCTAMSTPVAPLRLFKLLPSNPGIILRARNDQAGVRRYPDLILEMMAEVDFTIRGWTRGFGLAI